MGGWLLPALAATLSFLAGSVPFAWITTKAVKGIDLRSVGSGNVGATNASRVLGRRWFLFVFILDAAKGALPVLLAPMLTDPMLVEDGPAAPARLAMACGLAAILGHVFCPWLGWKGGKGVATGAGVLGALAPLPAAAALGVFLLTLAVWRYVSLSSCLACAVLGPLAFGFGTPPETSVFFIVVGALVIWLHRPNLARIARGTEPKVFRRKTAEEGPHA
jgi:glycerol-3-phosphate acyltransferase PlsY